MTFCDSDYPIRIHNDALKKISKVSSGIALQLTYLFKMFEINKKTTFSYKNLQFYWCLWLNICKLELKFQLKVKMLFLSN